jgi:hypothetical protein
MTFRAHRFQPPRAAGSRNERGRRSRSPPAGGGHGGRGARGGGTHDRLAPRLHEEGRAVLIDGHAGDALGDAVEHAPRLRREGGVDGKGLQVRAVTGTGVGEGGGAPHLRSLAPASLDEPGRLAAPRRGHGAVREAERGRPGRGERAHRGTPPPARAGSERRVVVTREKNAIDPRRRRRRRKQWTATTCAPRRASGEKTLVAVQI